MKYHPKNDPSSEAAQKFQELADAYNQLTEEVSHREEEKKFGTLFNDFEKQIDDFLGPIKKETKKIAQKSEKLTEPQASKVSESEKDNFIKNADLYSESTYVQTHNGKNKKLVIQKSYKKDDKILKVKREQKYNQDGIKEITQTLDDGKEVKKKTFTENKEAKAIGN